MGRLIYRVSAKRSAAALGASLAGLLLGASVVAAATPTSTLSLTYLDGAKSFCTAGSLVEVVDPMIVVGEGAAATPRAAVDVFLNESRRGIDSLPETLQDLLTPLQEFDVEQSFLDEGRGISYFDSGTGDYLRARLTVQEFESDGWYVVNAVRCEDTVVSDRAAFQREADRLRTEGK